MSAHTAKTELKLIGKLILEGELHCRTGLHIGRERVRWKSAARTIPSSRTPSDTPMCPGVRCGTPAESAGTGPRRGRAVELVYLSKRKGQEVRIHQSNRPDDEICLLFGRNAAHGEGERGGAGEHPGEPGQARVCDAPLDPDSVTPQMRENWMTN